MHNLEVWLKGLLAAAIAGAANGIITGFAAVGIDPGHFNLQAGLRPTLAIAGASAMMSAIIGTAAYLKQSPLPDEPDPVTGRELAADFAGQRSGGNRDDRDSRDNRDGRGDDRDDRDNRDPRDPRDDRTARAPQGPR